MSNPSVVIQVVQHLQPGGIETMALDLQRFAAADEVHYIVSLEGSKEAALKAWPRLKPFENRLIFFTKRPGRQWRLIFELKRLYRELGACAVHTHHVGPLIYGGLAARLAGIPVVHTEHDAWHLDNNRRRRVQQVALALVRPTVVADADAVAAGLRDRLGLNDVRIIRNGIDTERFAPGDRDEARRKLRLPTGVPLVGSAGRLEPVKGQATLIEAMARMPEDVHLALAGDGSERDALQQKAVQLDLASRVHFLGRVDDMPVFYRALDVFCLPSKREGMPLAPMEAQACGVPAVVTDTGGASETICPHTGALVRPGDADAMAKALHAALGNEDRRRPREFVEKTCNVRGMTAAYAALRSHAVVSGATS